MRVGVHGLRDGGVTEHLLDDLRVDVFREKQGSAGVTQAVKGEAFTLFLGPEPCPLQQGLEVTVVEVVMVHGLALNGAENKAKVFNLLLIRIPALA